jgi:hypothetical protein
MLHPELSAAVAREQYQDQHRQAARRRLAARVGQGQLPLLRRAARPLGHILLRLGTGLLRYGQVESPIPTSIYQSSIRSIELN